MNTRIPTHHEAMARDGIGGVLYMKVDQCTPAAKPRIESWQIDATHELQPTDKVEFDPVTATLKLNMPEATVLFIRLSQP